MYKIEGSMKNTAKNINTHKIDIFKNFYLASFEDTALGSELYQTAVKNAHLLCKPIFAFNGISSVFNEITYRKLNDWDEKGLLNCNRENNEKGWRRFSIRDIVRMNIIQDLKNYGFNNDKIVKTLDNVFEEVSSEFKYNFFEYFFSLYFAQGVKIVLVVKNDGSSILISELNLIKMLGANLNDGNPILILPFYKYLASIGEMFLGEETALDKRFTALGLICTPLNERYKKVIEIIEDKNYSEIQIHKKGEEFIVKATGLKNNDVSKNEIIRLLEENQFLDMNIKQRNGDILSLSITDLKKI